MTISKAIKRMLFICPIFPALLIGQRAPRKNVNPSCREFVQGFYNWYVPMALRDSPLPSSAIALKQKPQVFAHKLLRQLAEDFRAQEKADGDLVGIDFDPFLASQDPGERYVVESVTRDGANCRAEVYAVSSGKKSKDPDVMPDLRLENGHWVFVDFLYPNPSRPEFRSLSSQLEYLRKLRKEPAK